MPVSQERCNISLTNSNKNQRRCTDATHFILSPSIIPRNKKAVIWSGEVQDCSRFCGDGGWHGFCFSSTSHTWKSSCRRAWGGWGLKILQWQEHQAQTKNKTSHALSNLTCFRMVCHLKVSKTPTQNLHPSFGVCGVRLMQKTAVISYKNP